jgi:hypothetical protein
MEARVEKLEEFAIDVRERLMKIETRLDQTATKADLAQAVADMVRWVVGTAIALVAVAVTVMTFVLNYATPPRTPMEQSQAAPIVIQLPPYPTVPPPR